MRRDLLSADHCLWCGATLRHSKVRFYCSGAHADLQAHWAAHATTIPLQRCPTPKKHGTRYRGTALRFAVFRAQYPYHCDCGLFHLTSKTKSAKRYASALIDLAADLHVTPPPIPSGEK